MPSEEVSTCTTSLHRDAKVMLGLVTVKIKGHAREVETYAFLDGGSDITSVATDLIERLKLESTSTSIFLATVTGTSLIYSKLNTFDVLSLDSN